MFQRIITAHFPLLNYEICSRSPAFKKSKQSFVDPTLPRCDIICAGFSFYFFFGCRQKLYRGFGLQ